ncbi:hypothetical protein FO440_10915 [Mucilaginibacter corticis]|uniref:Uncharacterized protein n=1 Tax=Mucilaginibacter corticis TaxID=2597670 RepID=A0A556MK36_9SPHI|nr:hypothetical protein [Mucilaginibacter corticis]TSJ40267.1 hypothetical protein FO440_10915 [Mucilaginibacter corticis]
MNKNDFSIGDRVFLLNDLIERFKFKVYTIESKWQSGLTELGKINSYFLADNVNRYYDNDLVLVKSFPEATIYLTDGEYSILKRHIADDLYLNEKIKLEYINDAPILRTAFNYEDIHEVLRLGMGIGEILNTNKSEIEELNKISYEGRAVNKQEVYEANKRWNQDQDRSENIDEDYNQNGDRKDDPYNHNNWEGHCD